jgi:hypothetical protein
LISVFQLLATNKRWRSLLWVSLLLAIAVALLRLQLV